MAAHRWADAGLPAASSPAPPTALSAVASALVDVIAASPPAVDAHDVRAWRNIPDCVRTAIANLAEHGNKLAQGQVALSSAIHRKANGSELADALAGKADAQHLTDLSRLIQKDVLPRIAAPCASHASLAQTVVALTSRMAELEALVVAQDKHIQ
ncbi:MAG: hypothetical protein EOO41_01220, partial [Methanobacteriota archaeon]